MRKRVVIFGGGSGLSNIIGGLKLFPIDITAVVSVSDNGGSSGIIRKVTDLPAIGDLRKVYTTMSDDFKLSKLLSHRFKGPLFKNHPVGNIILLALYELEEYNLENTLRAFEELLGIRNQVLPASLAKVTLKATYESGVVYGEKEIHKRREHIIKLENEPNDCVNRKVLEAIDDADLIIYSPGSFYTSTMAGLSYPSVIDALSKSNAKKLYIANIMTESNETYGFRLSNHVLEMSKLIGKHNLDLIIANNDYRLPNKIKKKYKREKSIVVLADKGKLLDYKLWLTRLWEVDNSYVRHDSFKLARILLEILYEE